MKSLKRFLAVLAVVAAGVVSLALYGTQPSAGPEREARITTTTTTTTQSPVPVGKAAGQGLRRLVGGRSLGRLRLGTTEWLFLVLLLAVLVRLWALARARRCGDPGSVEVALFTNATGDTSLEPEGMAWLMRERLAWADLKPTLLPGDAGGDEILKVVAENPLTAATPVAKVFTYLRTLSKVSRGYRVTGGFLRRTEPPSCGVSIQITNIGKGRVEAVRALWATSYEEAAIEAAYLAASVVSRGVKTDYRWERWTSEDGRSLRLYHELKQYAATGGSDTYDHAFALAYEAIACDPGNALLRLELAKLSEVVEGFFDSLDAYLTIVARWPDCHMARYRLSSVLSFVDEWVDTWYASRSPGHGRNAQHVRIRWQLGELVGDSQRAELEESLDHTDVGHFKAAMLRLSNEQRRRIQNDPKVGKGSLGSLAITARLIGELQLCKLNIDKASSEAVNTQVRGLEAELRTELGRKRAKWQAHYNAACFYAHWTEMADPGAAEALHQALAELDVVIDEGKLMTPAEQTWLRKKDPDLRPLRDTADYRHWALRAFGYPTPPELPAVAVRVVNQRVVWKVLANAKRDRWDEWYQRVIDDETPPVSTLQDLEASCRREADFWRTLEVLCASPENQKARKRLARGTGTPLDLPALRRKVFVLDGDALSSECRSSEAYLAALSRISSLQGPAWEQRARVARDAALGLRTPPDDPRSRDWAMDGERTWFAVSAVVDALQAAPPHGEAVTDALEALRQVSDNLAT